MAFFAKKIMRSINRNNSHAFNHWLYQKLSALLMLPLTIWFLVKLPLFISFNYTAKVKWLVSFPNYFLLILFYVVASFHMMLGLTAVIEDYIHNPRNKKFYLALITIFSFVLPVVITVLILLMKG